MRLFEFSKSLENEQDAEDPHSGNAPKVADVPDDHKATMNPSLCFTDMDPGHEFYRFMMQAAASPNDIPVEASLNSAPFSMPFSKEDADMLHHAFKRMGKKVKHIAPGKGSDPKDAHNKSPVAAVKKNRYGV
jgi:hypothetical protein